MVNIANQCLFTHLVPYSALFGEGFLLLSTGATEALMIAVRLNQNSTFVSWEPMSWQMWTRSVKLWGTVKSGDEVFLFHRVFLHSVQVLVTVLPSEGAASNQLSKDLTPQSELNEIFSRGALYFGILAFCFFFLGQNQYYLSFLKGARLELQVVVFPVD